MNLYDLTNQWKAVYDILTSDTATDEELAAAMAEADALDDGVVTKATGYAYVLRNMQAEAEVLGAEAKRLTALKRQRENAADRIKQRMMDAMQVMEVRKLPSDIGTWSIAKNPASVEITDEAAIPDDYLIPQKPMVDKAGIKAAIAAGGEVPGALLTQGESVRFR